MTDTEVCFGSGSAASEGRVAWEEPTASIVALPGLMGVAGRERWMYHAKTVFFGGGGRQCVSVYGSIGKYALHAQDM